VETDLNFAWQQSGPVLAMVMHAVSFLGSEDFFLLLVPFIFWCVDSGFGARLLFLVVTSDFVNGLLKWTFHLPRPYWVDPRVKALDPKSVTGCRPATRRAPRRVGGTWRCASTVGGCGCSRQW